MAAYGVQYNQNVNSQGPTRYPRVSAAGAPARRPTGPLSIDWSKGAPLAAAQAALARQPLNAAQVPPAPQPAPGYAPAAAPAAPAGPDYEAMFRQSIDRQRASIDTNLRQAMTDIGARRAAAEQVVGLQPSEVNAIYNQAAPAIDKNVNAAKADLASAGASAPTAGQMAGVDAIKAAIEGSRTASLADQPYLKIGTNELFNRQAGMAGSIAQDQRGQIENQMTNYYSQRAASKDDNNQAFQNQLALMGLKQQAAQAQSQREAQTLMAAQPSGSKAWWQAYSAYDPENAAKLQGNFNSGAGQVDQWKKSPSLWNKAKTYLSPQYRSFLNAQYGLK